MKQVDASLFATFNDWRPVVNGEMPAGRFVKVMYSNGFVGRFAMMAETWQNWIGGRDWWKPQPDRLHIVAYVVL